MWSKITHFISLVHSWSLSWSSASERAQNCRNTPTPSCSRLPTTVPTSWNRWWTLWRSRADRTAPHRPPAASSDGFSFHNPRMSAEKHKRSRPHPHMQLKDQNRHTYGEDWRLVEVKCTLQLASGCGRGGLLCCHPLASLPLRTFRILFTLHSMAYINTKHPGKRKPEDGGDPRDKLSIISHLCVFASSWPVLRPAGGGVCSMRARNQDPYLDVRCCHSF